MEINKEMVGETLRFRLSGAIDGPAAEQLKSEFLAGSLSGVKVVSFDMGGVSHIGSAGLGKLLLFYKHVSAAGGRMQVENCPMEIAQLLRELKLDSLFSVR